MAGRGDVAPPDDWPAVAVEESAPRSFRILRRDGDPVTFRFHGGVTATRGVAASPDDEGIMHPRAAPDARWARKRLRRTRARSSEAYRRRRDRVGTVSLSGSTAACGRNVGARGFRAAGVID